MVSSGLEVTQTRVNEMQGWLLKNGLKKVEKTGTAAKPLNSKELAAKSREKSEQDREEKLRAIISRQKKDHLAVYINRRGAYVNGKSISSSDIKPVIKATGLKKAVITYEIDAEQKVADWQKKLRAEGLKTNKVVNKPKPKAKKKPKAKNKPKVEKKAPEKSELVDRGNTAREPRLI